MYSPLILFLYNVTKVSFISNEVQRHQGCIVYIEIKISTAYILLNQYLNTIEIFIGKRQLQWLAKVHTFFIKTTFY